MSKIGKATAAAALAMVMGAAPALAEDGVRGKLAGDLVIGVGAIGVLQAAGRAVHRHLHALAVVGLALQPEQQRG